MTVAVVLLIYVVLELINAISRPAHRFFLYLFAWCLPRYKEVRKAFEEWEKFERITNSRRWLVFMAVDICGYWISWTLEKTEHAVVVGLVVATPLMALIFHSLVRPLGNSPLLVFLPAAVIFPLAVRYRGAAIWAASLSGVTLGILQDRGLFIWTLVGLIQVLTFIQLLRWHGWRPRLLDIRVTRDVLYFVCLAVVAIEVGGLIGTTWANIQDTHNLTRLTSNDYSRYIRWIWSTSLAAGLGLFTIHPLLKFVGKRDAHHVRVDI